MSTSGNMNSESHQAASCTQKLEYSEQMNVAEVHGTILREKMEPHDGQVPVPLWLITFFLILAFCCGGYLLKYSGGFRGDVFDESEVTYGPVVAGAGAAVDPLVSGKKLFTANCVSCHQATGLGLPGTYPPLAGSEYVNGPSNRLVKIVLGGLQGPITVKGATYNGAMPEWKKLSDEKISYILTYIRQEWGNKSGPITPAGVAKMRAEMASRTTPWTIQEIMAIPAADL